MVSVEKKSELVPVRKEVGSHRLSRPIFYWEVCIDPEAVLNHVTRDSNYREHALENGGERYILMEDDRGLFYRFFRSVVSELWLKLGRMAKRMREGVEYSGDVVVMKLEVSRNHDDNMMFSLGGFIGDYVCSAILRSWYLRNGLNDEALKCGNDADAALSDVVAVVHYRKRAVRRPIDPLF